MREAQARQRAASTKDLSDFKILIECLARTTAPAKSVGRPLDGDHTDSMVFRSPARISGDDDDVAGLQRFTRNALSSELTGSAPFDGPAGALIVEYLNE